MTQVFHGLGATEKFPEGKLTPHDEGELRFAVGAKDGNVIIEFGTSVRWFGLPPAVARQLATALIKRANLIEGKTG